MRSNNSKLLKGRVAVISSEDNRIACQKVCVELEGNKSKMIIGDLAKTYYSELRPYRLSGTDLLDSFLWVRLKAYSNFETLSDGMAEFSRQVVAALGSGYYLFDLAGHVHAPYKLSKFHFRKFAEFHEMDYQLLETGTLVSSAFKQNSVAPCSAATDKEFNS